MFANGAFGAEARNSITAGFINLVLHTGAAAQRPESLKCCVIHVL